MAWASVRKAQSPRSTGGREGESKKKCILQCITNLIFERVGVRGGGEGTGSGSTTTLVHGPTTP